MPARPIDTVAAVAGADVDLLAGANTDEHNVFTPGTRASSPVFAEYRPRSDPAEQIAGPGGRARPVGTFGRSTPDAGARR